MLRISGIRLTLDQPLVSLKQKVAHKLRVTDTEILDYTIVKESIDARKRNEIYLTYVVDVILKDESRCKVSKLDQVKVVEPFAYELPSLGDQVIDSRPVVVGFGPAGMFAALILAQAGLRPIVYERGDEVDVRIEKVNTFWETGVLDKTSNVQFGEGGAGTFSDGKLTTRGKDLRANKVLEEFVAAGASDTILYEAHPHIGTDRLRVVVKKIRQTIIELGGEVHFQSQVERIVRDQDAVSGIVVNGKTIACQQVILAIGHSARDTFSMLAQLDIEMVAKPFAVGVRIEHPQQLIDQAQYGDLAGHPRLKAAEYRMTHQSSNHRGVYTFCMCPGGVVVPSASDEGHLVVNGMSEFARDQVNANSAVLVQVSPDDFGDDALAGVRYQEQLEKRAFELGGSNFHAPVQLVGDFLNNRPTTKLGSVAPSYAIGVTPTDLSKLFDEPIVKSLQEGILAFDRQLHGFAMADAVMTGVESRSSSPLRILRDKEQCVANGLVGLYPCGEGAGYAGGIVSAAVDGIRCAEAIIKQYK